MDQANRLFISYSSKDRDFVKRLVGELKSYGVEVWWDHWEMKVGDSINKKLQQGISQAGWLGVVLSPNSVKSRWVEVEINSALTKELESREVFILPILQADCDIPLFLKDKVYADFRSSFQDGMEALLGRVAPGMDAGVNRRLLSEDVDSIRAAFARLPAKRRPEYIDWLVKKLASDKSSERRGALMALYVLRYEHLADYLKKLAGDASKSTRALAVFYLGELRIKEARPLVIELTQDASPDVRAAARNALAQLDR